MCPGIDDQDPESEKRLKGADKPLDSASSDSGEEQQDLDDGHGKKPEPGDSRKKSDMSRAARTKRPEPLSEVSGKRKKRVYIVLAVLIPLVLACLAAYFFYFSKNNLDPQPLQQKEAAVHPPVKPSQAQPIKKEPAISTAVEKPAADQSLPEKKLENLVADAVALRKDLLVKADEIVRLKMHYQGKILDVEDEIIKEKGLKGINGFKKALQDKHVELRLRTIQRRQAYIRRLNIPARWLNNGSEALLYLKRKSEIETSMAPVARGIDITSLEKELENVLEKYRLKDDSLAVNMDGVELQPMETIWKRILIKENGIAKKIQRDTAESMKDNLLISKEICNENFSNISALTFISPDTAMCLSKWKGSDMMVNHVSEMPPDIAERLFQWKGYWMSLNGLKKITPGAARSMFRWKGKWLSLNKVSDFSPDAAKYISGWKGKQLELMGLKLSNGKGKLPVYVNYLYLWEKRGGRLLVSDAIRKRLTEAKK